MADGLFSKIKNFFSSDASDSEKVEAVKTTQQTLGSVDPMALDQSQRDQDLEKLLVNEKKMQDIYKQKIEGEAVPEPAAPTVSDQAVSSWTVRNPFRGI